MSEGHPPSSGHLEVFADGTYRFYPSEYFLSKQKGSDDKYED